MTHSWEMQRRQEEAIAHKRLTAAAAMAESGLVQIPHLNIHCKVTIDPIEFVFYF